MSERGRITSCVVSAAFSFCRFVSPNFCYPSCYPCAAKTWPPLAFFRSVSQVLEMRENSRKVLEEWW